MTEDQFRALFDDKAEADRIIAANPPRRGPVLPAPAAATGAAIEVPERPRRKQLHERFVMNQTESRFAAVLDRWKAEGRVKDWAFERDTLILTPDMEYTPDFDADLPDGRMMYVDVKGKHTFEDSVVKGKAAAGLFPYHRFYLAKLVAGEWRIRRLGVEGRQVEVIGV